jgi:hypothetical protein
MYRIFFIAIISCVSLVAHAQPATATQADTVTKNDSIRITIKDNGAWYNGSQIAVFKKKLIDNELTSIVIYNMSKARVAEVTYIKGEENWTIATPVDQNKMYLKYNKLHSLEDLFQYLVEKKYL